jgi:hypothetical protein
VVAVRIAPVVLNRWVAGLFVVGSSLFVLGSVPPYITGVGETIDAATYALGAVFFTAAALGQLVQAQDPTLADPAPGRDRERVHVPPLRTRRGDRGWTAAALQLPGTVFFNISTIAALSHNLTTAQTDHRVWRPDVYGSVLFLAASVVALLALGGAFHARPRSAAWWAAWLNMGGSVAFMAAALAGYVLPSTDEVLNVPVAVGGTFLGALCFLVGAVLLLPAWRQQRVPV